MGTPDRYRVYAIQYAYREERKRYETFITNAWTDALHDTPQPISYYVWAIVNRERAVVVDTGFDAAEAARRREATGGQWRPQMRCTPAEGLARIGVDAAKVRDVVITHLHYDHAGCLGQFPAARFHLQELEMQFATGPCMAHAYFNGAYTVEHVVEMVRNVYQGRVAFHAAEAEIAPGISVHRIGGHTLGLQCVRVCTEAGPVVLASDASHYFDNVERDAPYPIVHDVARMLDGFARLRELAGGDGRIVPGHDPAVMERYPAPDDASRGVVARLDVQPVRVA